MLVSEKTGAEVVTIEDERGEQLRRPAPEIDDGSFAEPCLAYPEESPVELHRERGMRRLLERHDPPDEIDSLVALPQAERALREEHGELVRRVVRRKDDALELDPVAQHRGDLREGGRQRHGVPT